MNSFLNIAGYRFIKLNQLDTLKTCLYQLASDYDLVGTVLLANEGVNIFLAGYPANIEHFRSRLATDQRFESVTWKDSWSSALPFKRLKVKIKKEIITFLQEDLNPLADTAPFVSPTTLKKWLDQGHDDDNRPVRLLDTRNRFEVNAGSFHDAIDAEIDKFSDFPDRVKQLAREQPDLPESTIVTFCTGGIRCEKAAPWMLKHGFNHVYQIEGGILNYFKQCGDAHYQGSCVVFDERHALDHTLSPVAV